MLSTTACSADYLVATLKPSRRLSDPKQSRKMLVLDLNGTLVFRPRKQSQTRTAEGHRLRPAHPRPYLTSFLLYLAHPNTTSWLDSMIWSSAQPHSVTSMIEKCNIQNHTLFRAVWDREHFDLTPEQYQKKSQTVKDLSKVFTAFPEHSESSTILLDDSYRKAQRQPFNHICLPEYGRSSRTLDVKILRGEVTNQPYDQTLLAIIGILDSIKWQSNVGSWIRAGHLYHLDNVILGAGGEDRDWFADAGTVQNWVAKGLAALEALGLLESTANPLSA